MFDEYEKTFQTLKKNKFSIGWLDTSNQINNLQARVISQNLIDFFSFEHTYLYDIKTYIDNNIDNLLYKSAQEDNNWLLIVSLGTILSKNNELLDVIAKEIENWKNVAVMGHILDKKQEYYKIHPQTLIVNLNWYKENNYPCFGETVEANWENTAPTRSTNNFHDDYTPTWIKQGNIRQTYTKKHEGWNLIKTALESGYEINPFNHIFRDSKKYIYPEDDSEWSLQLGDILSKTKTDVYFLCNTEEKIKCPTNLYSTFDVCIIPASGFNPIIMPWLLGMKKNTKVIVYDISQPALNASKIMHENYNGQDIKEFWENYFLEFYGRKSVSESSYLQMNESVSDELKNGMKDWLNFVKPSIKYEFKKIDILNFSTWNNLEVNGTNVFLSLSNIFHYFPTSILFSLKDKILIHNFLIEKLKSMPNNWYLDYRELNNKTRSIKNLNEIPLATVPDELKLFPWNN